MVANTRQRNLASANDLRNAADSQLVTRREAARILAVSLRWLEATHDVPKVNIARPGAKRPTYRYRLADLSAFGAARVVGRDSERTD